MRYLLLSTLAVYAGSVLSCPAAFGAKAAPVILTGPTCTANSPSSAKCTWTTDTASSSQVRCGTVSGGPYTYQTTEVRTASAGPGIGVTPHAMVIPGLPTNAASNAYLCQVISRTWGSYRHQRGGGLGNSAGHDFNAIHSDTVAGNALQRSVQRRSGNAE
jgi:hypothetical protein